MVERPGLDPTGSFLSQPDRHPWNETHGGEYELGVEQRKAVFRRDTSTVESPETIAEMMLSAFAGVTESTNGHYAAWRHSEKITHSENAWISSTLLH